jgi:hypothetical protein
LMSVGSGSIDPAEIVQRIVIVRGQRVLFDTDLAALYGVPTRRLNEQVRRNQNRFPSDFMFRFKISELQANQSQIATGSRKHREALEKSVVTLDARTRKQFEEVYAAIRALMAPAVPKSRPIGFMAELGKDR